MPALGMAQDTGTLIRWLKQEGQAVTKGEPLMEVETDKATVEVEAAATGTLARVTAHDGDVIPVAQVIALILAPGEVAPEKPAPAAATAPAAPLPDRARPAQASPVAVKVAEAHGVDLGQVAASGEKITKADVLAYVESGRAVAPSGNGGARTPASPKARRLANERGVALATLRGSGPDGAVLAADVLAAQVLAIAPSGAPAGQALDISRAWVVMAERLSEAWTSIPHFYLLREVDATRLMAWREQVQQKSQEKITYTDLLVRLTAAALEKHPRLNGSWNGSTVVLNPEINIGLAVAVEDGLLVPVIHHADALSTGQIASARRELVERANGGRLRLEDLQGGTFTISNLGMYGVDGFNAIVNPPQAAILAVGRIADRVVPVDGQPAVRPMMMLSLSCDHRAVDGARGAQFLDSLAALIEEPLGLVD